jgi:hypothetical protein
MTRIATFIALTLSLWLFACNATSTAMRPIGHVAVVGAPDAATIVFVRPSGWKGEDRTTILDEHGRFLGDSLASSYFAVRVPPGENVFVSCSSNTAALRAIVAPKKIYFVEVSPRLGLFATRFALLAVHPGAPSGKRLDRWMTESAAYVPDEQAGQAMSRAHGNEGCFRRARAVLDDYSEADLRARTLLPDDGR